MPMLHTEEGDFQESPQSGWTQNLDYSDPDHVLPSAPFSILLTEPSQKAFLTRATACLSGKGSSLKDYFLNQHLSKCVLWSSYIHCRSWTHSEWLNIGGYNKVGHSEWFLRGQPPTVSPSNCNESLPGPQFHCSLSSASTIMCNLHCLGHHTTQGRRTLPGTLWLRFETTIMDCNVFAVHTMVFFFSSHKNVMVWLQRGKMFKCFPAVDLGSIKLVYLAMYSVWIFDWKFFYLSYWLEFHFQKKGKKKGIQHVSVWD